MKQADLFWVHKNSVGWKKQWGFSDALKNNWRVVPRYTNQKKNKIQPKRLFLFLEVGQRDTWGTEVLNMARPGSPPAPLQSGMTRHYHTVAFWRHFMWN